MVQSVDSFHLSPNVILLRRMVEVSDCWVFLVSTEYLLGLLLSIEDQRFSRSATSLQDSLVWLVDVVNCDDS